MLGPANNRPPHEAILFFYLSKKSVVLILFLKKLDMDSNSFALREVGGHVPHNQYAHNVLNVSVLQAKTKTKKPDCCNCPPVSSPWVGV